MANKPAAKDDSLEALAREQRQYRNSLLLGMMTDRILAAIKLLADVYLEEDHENRLSFTDQLYWIDQLHDGLNEIFAVAPLVEAQEARHIYKHALLLQGELGAIPSKTLGAEQKSSEHSEEDYWRYIQREANELLTRNRDGLFEMVALGTTLRVFANARHSEIAQTLSKRSGSPESRTKSHNPNSIKIRYDSNDTEFVFKFTDAKGTHLYELKTPQSTLYGRMLFALSNAKNRGLTISDIQQWVYPKEKLTNENVVRFRKKAKQLVFDAQDKIEKSGLPREILVLQTDGILFSVNWNVRECLSIEESKARNTHFKEIQSGDPELVARKRVAGRKPTEDTE